MGRLVRVVAVGLLGCLACKSESPVISVDDGAPLAPLLGKSLQIQPERLSRLEFTRPGQQPVTLEGSDGRWSMVSPVSFLADQRAVDAIIAVLAEIEIQRLVADRPGPEHRLGENSGIIVKAWTRDQVMHQFTIGASAGEETYIQRAGETQVYVVQGRCRRVFETPHEQLRHPVITKLELTDIERVVYANPFGEIGLVADPSGPGRFGEISPSIRNFNGDRASKNVAVLAGLRAKGFVDPPIDKAATGLFDEDTARATIALRGQKNPLIVWTGARTSDGRLHVRTSDSDQIYLVSAHLASSLIPQRRHFERSDEQMHELQARIDARTAGPTDDTTAHRPAHEHGKPPPTRVPPELMRELRDLAL